MRIFYFLCGLMLTTASALAQTAGPALTVDTTADRHPISLAIYGMAYADPVLTQEIHLPLNRWGGDATTRYNWKVDGSNSGDDWFYMAGGGKPNPVASGGPDALITRARSDGGRVLLTIPVIDFINSATNMDCSFPVSIFGPQEKVNPYVHPIVNGKQTDAGNGKTPAGKSITLTKEQILRVHTPNSPDFERGWIQHIVSKFGTSARGGVGVYELDNEPGGWNNTHRDVHPDATGHDELVLRSAAYAAMIKSVDSSALIAGPGDFVMHYQSDGKPGDGKKEHSGLTQGNYYLQQMRNYERQHGQRILDFFDEHYYPTKQDGETDDTILECTRSLWDPTYKEKNWVGKWQGAIELIPSFHRWVDQYYPGTKVSISEYGWGDRKTLVGALAQAEVLGIFGRERLDMACAWNSPKAGDPAANSWRIYLNYDGQGSKYGDTWVKSVSEDQSQLSIYASQRTQDRALTIIVINKTHGDLTSNIALSHYHPAAAAKAFRFGGDNLTAIVAQPDQAVKAGGFSATFPAQSITLFVVPGR